MAASASAANSKSASSRITPASDNDDSPPHPPPPPHGWTSMRTLHMKRMKKGTGSGSGQSGSTGSAAGLVDSAQGGGKGGATATVAESGGSADDVLNELRSDDGLLGGAGGYGVRSDGEGIGEAGVPEREIVAYKVYKRRWFGLVQLVLLNIIVSWDWLTYSALSTTTAQYFNTTATVVNWLSTSFLFAFVVAAPVVIYTIHKGGPKLAIIVASVLLLAGNWIRYGGTKSGNFGAVMFGQILTGLAQPFVLAVPTRYSDLWFTGAGRVAATAVMSLANPLGGALAQLIDPAWVNDASDIPSMVLYVTIISTVATIPSFFIPARPPTPCSASSTDIKQDIMPSIKALIRLPEFYMIAVPYAVLVGFFNSLSSLINQILEPYGFSETEAGIAGGLLIVVGLIAAAVSSPVIDRSKKYLMAIKVQIPIIGICYLAFIWAPPTRSVAAVYTILSILGAASFSLVPIVLEYLCEITHPISPEVTSTICWTGGQLLGGIFIVIASALTDGPNGGAGGSQPYNMQRVLWFQAVLALLIVPLPLSLGLFGRKNHVRMRRIEADKAAVRVETASTQATGDFAA